MQTLTKTTHGERLQIIIIIIIKIKEHYALIGIVKLINLNLIIFVYVLIFLLYKNYYLYYLITLSEVQINFHSVFVSITGVQ